MTTVTRNGKEYPVVEIAGVEFEAYGEYQFFRDAGTRWFWIDLTKDGMWTAEEAQTNAWDDAGSGPLQWEKCDTKEDAAQQIKEWMSNGANT